MAQRLVYALLVSFLSLVSGALSFLTYVFFLYLSRFFVRIGSNIVFFVFVEEFVKAWTAIWLIRSVGLCRSWRQMAFYSALVGVGYAVLENVFVYRWETGFMRLAPTMLHASLTCTVILLYYLSLRPWQIYAVFAGFVHLVYNGLGSDHRLYGYLSQNQLAALGIWQTTILFAAALALVGARTPKVTEKIGNLKKTCQVK